MKIKHSRHYTVSASSGSKHKLAVKATLSPYETWQHGTRYERMEFADRIIDQLVDEFGKSISSDAYGMIMDLAEDLGYGNRDALENAIYDIYEEDTGIIIASTVVNANVNTSGYGDSRDAGSPEEKTQYVTALSEGVIKELNDQIEYSTFIYEISDSTVTFSEKTDLLDADFEVVYILPLNQIFPDWNDLGADIEELSGCIWSRVVPQF
jgi:hypothetical protein